MYFNTYVFLNNSVLICALFIALALNSPFIIIKKTMVSLTVKQFHKKVVCRRKLEKAVSLKNCSVTS